MIRARFHTDSEDPRPVIWPIKHPYWVTGRVISVDGGDGYSIVVAYLDSLWDLLDLWPDAAQVTFQKVEKYVFTDRFPRPDWWLIRNLMNGIEDAARAWIETVTP